MTLDIDFPSDVVLCFLPAAALLLDTHNCHYRESGKILELVAEAHKFLLQDDPLPP